MSPDERPSSSRSDVRRGFVDSVRFHALRWLPLVGAAVVGYILFPPPAVLVHHLPETGARADRTVVAPFQFETPKSPEEINAEGESRAFSVRPVYRYSPTAYDSSLASARSFFAELERADAQGPDLVRAVAATRVTLGPAEAEYLSKEAQRRQVQGVVTHFLAELLSRGVADAGVLRGEPSRQVSLRRADVEHVVARDSILSFADLTERAEAAASAVESPAGQRVIRRLVAAFYQPTIVPDLVLTSSRREQLRASVDPVKYYVNAGERLTTVGQPVTEVAREKLAGLQAEVVRRGSGHPYIRGAAGALLYNGIVMASFWLLMLFYRRDTYDDLREMVFFGVLFAVVLLFTAGLHWAFPGRPELVPIPFAAIVVTLLYNGRIGVVAALTLAVLLDGQWNLRGTSILFFGLVGGVAAAVAIRVVRRRRHLYLTIGVMAAASVLASVTMGLIQGWTVHDDRGERRSGRPDGAGERIARDDRDTARRIGDADHDGSHAARAVRPRPPTAAPAGAGGARAPGPTASPWPTSANRPATSSGRTGCWRGSAATTTTWASSPIRASSWRTRPVVPTRTTISIRRSRPRSSGSTCSTGSSWGKKRLYLRS